MVEDFAIPEPKREEAWFGDGNWCQIIKKKRHNGPDDRPGWLFILRPSQKAVNWYNLRVGEELDQTYGFIRRWYPEKDVVILNDDRSFGRTLIKSDLFGDSTNLSRENEELRQYINQLESLVESLKAGAARLQEEYRALSEQTKLKLQQDADMLTTVRKGAGKLEGEDNGTGN